VIELVELVEADQDEEKTRELTLKNRIKEKPAVNQPKRPDPLLSKSGRSRASEEPARG